MAPTGFAEEPLPPAAEELGVILSPHSTWGSLAPAVANQTASLLGAVASTCDLYAYGPDKQLCVYNAKAAGALRCSRVLIPQLLDESFVRRHPEFWQESAHVQEDMVDEAHGGRALDMPFNVMQLVLNERGSVVALVGRQSVAVMRVPPARPGEGHLAVAASMAAVDLDGDEPQHEVTALLSRLGLGEYGGAFAAQGYDTALRDAAALRNLDAATRQQMVADLGMKPGHALALAMHLDGQLPVPPAAAGGRGGGGGGGLAVGPLGGAAAVTWEPCYAVPLLPPPPPPPVRPGGLDPPVVVPDGIIGGGVSAFSVPDSLLQASQPRLSAPAVLQVGFHPLSDGCLAVLYADGSFCLYEAARDLAAPELTLRVPPQPHGYQGDADAAVAFAFGTPAQRGWASLAVTFVSASGAMHVVCPLLPCEARVARPHIVAAAPELRACAGGSANAKVWLQRQLDGGGAGGGAGAGAGAGGGGALGGAGGAGGTADGAMMMLAVQGPLLAVGPEGEQVTSDSLGGGVRALAIATPPLAALRPTHAVGLSDHSVLIVAATQPTRPAWLGDRDAADGLLAAPTAATASAEPLLLLSRGYCVPASLQPAAPPLKWLTLHADPHRRGWLYVRSSKADVHLLAMEWLAEWSDYLAFDDRLRLAPPARTDPRPWQPPEAAPDEPPPSAFGATLLASTASPAAAPAAAGGGGGAAGGGAASAGSGFGLKVGARKTTPTPGNNTQKTVAGGGGDGAESPTAGKTPGGALWKRTSSASLLSGKAAGTLAAGGVGARGVVGAAVLADPCIAHAIYVLRGDGSAARLGLDGVVPGRGSARTAASQSATARKHDEALATLAPNRPPPRAVVVQQHRPNGTSRLEVAFPPELRAALGAVDAPTADALELVEEAFGAVAGGQHSALSHSVTIGAQSGKRLDAMLARAARQQGAPSQQQAAAEVREIVDGLRAKLAYSSALQSNLDLRARALQQALRTPALWPHAELSTVEREHVAGLDALRDGLLEVRRRLAQLKTAVPHARAQLARPRGGAGGGGGGIFGAGSAVEAEAEREALDDAQQKLAAHGELIDDLVEEMREARQHADAALQLARRKASADAATAAAEAAAPPRDAVGADATKPQYRRVVSIMGAAGLTQAP